MAFLISVMSRLKRNEVDHAIMVKISPNTVKKRPKSVKADAEEILSVIMSTASSSEANRRHV